MTELAHNQLGSGHTGLKNFNNSVWTEFPKKLMLYKDTKTVTHENSMDKFFSLSNNHYRCSVKRESV